MANYLCRDYLTQNTTTANRAFIPSTLVAVFLRRILKYTYVGDTNFNINSVGQYLFATGDTTPTVASTFPVGNKAGIANNGANIEVSIPVTVRGVTASDVGRVMALRSTLYPTRNNGLFVISGLQQGNVTTIAAGSNNVALPTGTINVASTTGFPASGNIFIGPSTTVTSVLNTSVGSGSNGAILPQSTIVSTATAGFPTSGTLLILTTNGPQVVTYTGTSGVNFTGCSGGTGTMATNNQIQLISTLTVGSTTGFTTTGSLSVLTTGGVQTVAYTGTTATTFTGCTGITSFLFATATVFSVNGVQTIAYTSTNATQFLGCTGGTGTLVTGESVYNQNKYVIDYRGNGDLSIVEAVDTMEWYLYDRDLNFPIQGGTNSGSGYRGNGNSTTPRVILQSPHATGWQVRICNENDTDALTNFVTPRVSFAPGFGGNSAGDFLFGGEHLHTAIFYDTGNVIYNCGVVGGGDNAGSGPQYRITMLGDDTGQSFHFFARRPGNATTPPAFNVHFGIPDNEPLPLPLYNVNRLFVLGNGTSNNTGNNRLSDITLSTGQDTSASAIQGMTTSRYRLPISCSPALLAYVAGNNQQASAMFDSSAGDSPFTSATELITVDLVAGNLQNWSASAGANVVFPYDPHVMGTLPFIRAGRTNFGDFVLTTDTGSWVINNATNATPIQITTTAPNTLVTGQTVAIHSVGGNTAANGTFVVTVINTTNFTLNGSVGSGAYTSGGTVLRGASFQHMRRGVYLPWNGPAVVP